MSNDNTILTAQDTPKAAEVAGNQQNQQTVSSSDQKPNAGDNNAKSAEGPKPEDKKVDDKATEGKPAVPEKYELKIPEKSLLSPAQIEKVSEYAKANKLTNEQAQALLERENSVVGEYANGLEQSAVAIKKQWLEASQSDKEFGGTEFGKNAELAKRVIERFGSDELKQELSASGLGNHPELVRMCFRIAKQMSEDQLVMPTGSQPGSSKKSIADVFYGGGDKKEN